MLKRLASFLPNRPYNQLNEASAKEQFFLEVHGLQAKTRLHSEAAIRHVCHAVYLGDHTAVCRILGRYKIFVDTRDVGLATHLMLEGYWEMWVTEAIVSLMHEGMVAADIGANVGYYTLLMADLSGPSGKVHAFEPNPRLAKLLSRSADVNGFASRVDVHCLALGDTDGVRTLIVPEGEPKNGHLIDLADDLPENGQQVPVSRLDGAVEWADIEFAKVDVEGAEELVWAGMQGMLDNGRLKTVVLEFTPGRYKDPANFLRALLAPGFSLSRIDYVRGIVEASTADVLNGAPDEDIMLVLQR